MVQKSIFSLCKQATHFPKILHQTSTSDVRQKNPG